MTGRFAELMALSASQTQEASLTAKQLLEERKRKEEQRKKEQLEKEKKEQEFQRKLIQARMEEQKREKERQERAEQEKRRREELLQKMDEERRQNLLHGSKGRGSSSNGARGRKGGSDTDLDSGAMALTREEKRQRRLMAQLNSNGGHRRSHGSSSHRQGNLLKGGAVDGAPIAAPINYSALPNEAGLTIKQRIAATPNSLIRLNTKKRDTRTIDEIVRDIKAREAKVLAGLEAKSFNDWFGKGKKHESTPSSHSSVSPAPPSRPVTPSQPLAKDKSPAPAMKSALSAFRSSASLHVDQNATALKKMTISKTDMKKSSSLSAKSAMSNKSSSSLATQKSGGPLRKDVHSSKATSANKNVSSGLKKRRRSESYDSYDSYDSRSPSPPPARKRAAGSSKEMDIGSEIWALFGKNKRDYTSRDVFSDEEDDMEADADDVLREELRSERIAKKEDEAALEEERRHEEEKRRRKKEKERRERMSQH